MEKKLVEEIFLEAYKKGFADARDAWQDEFSYDPPVAWLRFQREHPELISESEWFQKELERARKEGQEEGRKSVRKAYEAANKTLYEG